MCMFKIVVVLATLLLLSTSISANEDTFYMLKELKASKDILLQELKVKTAESKKVLSDDEKESVKREIKQLNTQIKDIETKFEKIATGVNVDSIKLSATESTSTLSEDFQLLLKPLIESAKETTKGIRQKAELQEEINHYKVMLPKASKAQYNIEEVLKTSKDTELNKDLELLKKYWEQQIQLLSSNLNASLHQVDVLEQNSVSFSSTVKTNTKDFFHERGLYLFEGLMAFILVLLIMQMINFITMKIFPIFSKSTRSFYLRLLDLLYRMLTVVLAIVVPMAVFYIEEDWFLFSIGLLLLIGMVWTFRNLISNLWQQARLFLNVGPVREEERIYYHGLPWRVKNINIFTIIENPVSRVSLRIPIEELVGLTSRPSHAHEPWFPCKLDDWLILSDTYYGKVIGLSLEFIELEDLGGGRRTYLVSDFLSLSPLNLSTDFRVVETFGISYRHQKESTNSVLVLLEEFLLQKIKEEDYEHGLKKLLVQFDSAGDSSLNIKVIANFTGDMAPLYFRMRRSINRWCVDACNTYDWEIPFPQLTIHKPSL